MNTPHEVGALVRGSRERLGLSRADLAHRAGLSLNSLQQLESGNANPTLDTLLRVAAVLGLQFHAEPSPDGPRFGSLPRSAASRKRARAAAMRQAARKAARGPLDADVQPRHELPPSAAEVTSVATATRAPFDLDAHLATFMPGRGGQRPGVGGEEPRTPPGEEAVAEPEVVHPQDRPDA